MICQRSFFREQFFVYFCETYQFQSILNIYPSKLSKLGKMNIPKDYSGTVFRRYKYGSNKKGIKLCRVPGCKKLQEYVQNTSLHLFPKDKLQRKTWVIKCRIAEPIKGYFAVCNHHF